MTEAERRPAPASQLAAEEFSFGEAIGGWRGFVESVIPGVLFVVTYLTWGGFRVPVLTAVASVAVLVAVRLFQRGTLSQALSGVFGVGIGAIWAWRQGDPAEYFVPGLLYTAALAVAALISLMVRRPLAGVVLAMIKGWRDGWWRKDPRAYRRTVWATWFFAGSQLVKLAVQLPLYLSGAVAALGTARLAMGVPYFALVLWVVWLMVRNLAPAQVPEDRRPQP